MIDVCRYMSQYKMKCMGFVEEAVVNKHNPQRPPHDYKFWTLESEVGRNGSHECHLQPSVRGNVQWGLESQ